MSQKKIPFWRHLLFLEAQPLVDAGKRKILSDGDLMEIPASQVPENLDKFEAKLDFSNGDRLIWSNLKALGWKFRWALFLNFLGAALGLLTPALVNQFIKLLSAPDVKAVLHITILLALAMGAVSILRGFLLQHYFYHILGCEQISTRVLNRRVFEQSMGLSLEARSKTPVGDIVNHMSSDSDGVSEFSFVFPDLFESVISILGVSIMLFYYLGWTALAPLFLFATLGPLTRKLASRFTHLDGEMMGWRDRRVSLMTQILSAIRVVKYFVWEKSVYEEVNEIRNKELKARRRMAQTEVMTSAAYTAVSSVVLFVTLGAHVLRGENLDVALVFTCIALFGVVEEPLGRMSHLLSRYTNSFVGSRRLVEFLKKETKLAPLQNLPVTNEPVDIYINQLSVGYRSSGPILQNIDLQVKAGESLAIVGPVGSGKSTLILAMLGEVEASQGKIEFWNSHQESVAPTKAFCPQEAYVINGSLAENLSFGEIVNEDEIYQAVKVTALQQDLKLFPAGLNTEIGEKGVNLSGGQKQRVALARAVLAKPAVVFLDDPLSAVDVDTERHLLRELLFGTWKEKTLVMATHRLEGLEFFDRIVYLDAGQVQAAGSFQEIMQNESFREFYSAHQHVAKSEKAQAATHEAIVSQESESRITEDEEREKGAVKSTVYWDYIRSLGGRGRFHKLNLFILFFGSTLVVLFPLAQKAWLSQISVFKDALWAVGIYGILGLATLLFTMANGLFWLERGVAAGRSMHDAMLKSILGAPIRFFDSTPVGRILQRFSRDIESVDVYLQWTFDSALHCFIHIIVTLVLISVILPATLIVMGPLLVFYYILQKNYRRPAREIKRMDSMARSPRYAHFKETLMGLSVIRGFNKEEYFLENFRKRLYRSQNTFYNHYVLNRWFSVRIPLLGGLITGATALLLTLAVSESLLSAGTGGLLLIYSLSFWGYLSWGVRMFSDIESRMTSIERLKYYSHLPQEKNHSLVPVAGSNWPSKGEIIFEQVSVRYADHLPLVLRQLSFKIQPGEKVGLIGRTGSGKSTLLQTLFRFVDVEDGRILLDGEDIATRSLEELRRSLAIIPQDPTLFMGNLRANLDRFNQFTDEEIYAALDRASILSFVQSLPGGLSYLVAENGSNFSQGQRQLFCLARALLIDAKVVVLDEATASVDVQTDRIIQKVIHESMQGITLLIVAHRLGTVLDCDRIIEMSAGQVKKIWRPQEKQFLSEDILK